MVIDTVGALCPHGRFELEGAPAGQLAGHSFAVKDLFDIAGRVTGAGNPKWLTTHEPAMLTAPPVTALLNVPGELLVALAKLPLQRSQADNVALGWTSPPCASAERGEQWRGPTPGFHDIFRRMATWISRSLSL